MTQHTSRHYEQELQVLKEKILLLGGKVEEAYFEYAAALRSYDKFARAHCHERRAAYEITRGWTATALRSMRAALQIMGGVCVMAL